MFEKRAHFILALLIILMPILAGGFYTKALLYHLGGKGSSQWFVTKKSSSSNSADVAKLGADLLEAKVSYAVLDTFGTRDVFRDPMHEGRFFFVTNNRGGGQNNAYVAAYDNASDEYYGPTGVPSVLPPRYLYSEKISADEKWYGIGMDGTKFIFWQTDVDNSPGPCASLWLVADLSYVDVGAAKAERKPYVISAAKKVEAQKEQADCEAGY